MPLTNIPTQGIHQLNVRRNKVEQAKVFFNYIAEQPDELSTKVEEVLEVVSKDIQERWREVGGV